MHRQTRFRTPTRVQLSPASRVGARAGRNAGKRTQRRRRLWRVGIDARTGVAVFRRRSTVEAAAVDGGFDGDGVGLDGLERWGETRGLEGGVRRGGRSVVELVGMACDARRGLARCWAESWCWDAVESMVS